MLLQHQAELLEDAIGLVDLALAAVDVDDVAARDDAHRQRVADHAQKLIAAAEEAERLVAVIERQGNGGFAVHVLVRRLRLSVRHDLGCANPQVGSRKKTR